MFVELASKLIQDKSMYKKKKFRVRTSNYNTPMVITVKNDEIQKVSSNNKNDKMNDEMIIMKNGKVFNTNQSMVSTCTSQRNRIQKINDINCKDFFFYLFNCKKEKGTAIIALCEDIYKEYLSCECLIKNTMNQEKIIDMMNMTQKVTFYQMKSQIIKKIESLSFNNINN